MQKFNDYIASYITPQMTLLEQMNAILEYLNKSSLYKHKLKIKPVGTGTEQTWVLINNCSTMEELLYGPTKEKSKENLIKYFYENVNESFSKYILFDNTIRIIVGCRFSGTSGNPDTLFYKEINLYGGNTISSSTKERLYDRFEFEDEIELFIKE